MNAKSRSSQEPETRLACALTGLTSQGHRSGRCMQGRGEDVRTPPREGPRQIWRA
jgi:hypothetical protein